MPDTEIAETTYHNETAPPVPYAIPYPPDRMRWALGMLGWSGHELARRLGMEQASVRQMMRTASARECPERVAVWLETLASLYGRFSPPSTESYDGSEPVCSPQRLRELLDILGWSASELGRRAGVSEHVVSNWTRNRGNQAAPAFVHDWLELLANILEALPRPIGWEFRRRVDAPEQAA